MFQVSINSIQKHLSYCQKTNFNQNFNLIVDAARPINANSLKNLAKNEQLWNKAAFLSPYAIPWSPDQAGSLSGSSL